MFFHLHARARRRKNFITRLQDGDQLAVSHDELQELASSHFGAILGTSVERDFALDLHSLGLCPAHLGGLDNPFSEEEVWAVVKALPSDKAPGPDGFTGRFYKTCWSVIKPEVMAALNSLFLANGRGFSSLNDTLISLLPKKDEAVDVKDFRPISPIHSFGKLFSKIPASRLSPHLGELVAPNQSASSKADPFHDNFRYVQLAARALHAKHIPRLLLKVDIAKAFDTGDPLSPMLFILVMDVLNTMLRKASESGGFLPLNDHASLYADDLVLFLSPSVLSSIPVHVSMVIGLPAWMIKAINKKRRAFLWTGNPYWDGLKAPAERAVTDMFQASTFFVPGDGRGASLPTFTGCRGSVDVKIRGLGDLLNSSAGPKLAFGYASVPVDLILQSTRNKDKETAMLADYRLDSDIAGDYDRLVWRWTSDQRYSAHSAYQAFFLGQHSFACVDLLLNAKGPAKCKFFLWFAFQQRCWMADLLQKRSIDSHSTCPFCAQELETANHILLDYVFARQAAPVAGEVFKIAIGIAKALEYLHNGSITQSVIHGDVKSSNILLSEDFQAQLCDFGLAKQVSASTPRLTCTDITGTFGYLAPEYFSHGKVNEKIDVYAFGVVILVLEIISGRRHIRTGCAKGQESLVGWAKPLLSSGEIKQLVDPFLGNDYDCDEMERMMLD
uniref:Retrotransposon protein, putative, LINE subclass n=2 Tax=Oryza sativa subsp. japonica TaxID=39947 RepID=Q10AV7_ORYSJ|nr:retrotransposon protein, putative, LINE subclass [Oryza sativa Japonica Group]